MPNIFTWTWADLSRMMRANDYIETLFHHKGFLYSLQGAEREKDSSCNRSFYVRAMKNLTGEMVSFYVYLLD